MKYTVEMVSGRMMYIPSFIKISQGFQKSGEGGYTNKYTALCSHKPLFHFFKIR
jgi:hypothetical protein